MLREGVVLDVSYEVGVRKPLVPVIHGVDGCTPTYFTIAGLIFVPLSIPFLEHAYGGVPSNPSPETSARTRSSRAMILQLLTAIHVAL